MLSRLDIIDFPHYLYNGENAGVRPVAATSVRPFSAEGGHDQVSHPY